MLLKKTSKACKPNTALLLNGQQRATSGLCLPLVGAGKGQDYLFMSREVKSIRLYLHLRDQWGDAHIDGDTETMMKEKKKKKDQGNISFGSFKNTPNIPATTQREGSGSSGVSNLKVSLIFFFFLEEVPDFISGFAVQRN